MAKEEEIKTIDDLLRFVNELTQKRGLLLWYRGVGSTADWGLLPSIQRTQRRMEIERFITNDFYIKARQVLERSPEKHNYAAWMSLMQHFGLPTRLLDWSRSPLIATFFATEKYLKYPQDDACVWVLTPGILNYEEGFGKCIYPVDAITVQEMLLPSFKEIENEKNANKIIACYSVENNLRMYSQQACFTIHNSQRRLLDICDEKMLYKIIIPKDRREYFLNSLRVFGITESFIYPDLDHISNDLKQSRGL